MDIMQGITLRPGDKVIYKPPHPDDCLLLESAQHWKDINTQLYAGGEAIISTVAGISKQNIGRYAQLIKDKPITDLDDKDPITTVEIELEIGHGAIDTCFFQKSNASQNNYESPFTIDDFIGPEPYRFQPYDFLLEMVDKSCKYNLYNLPLEKYFWYLDWELKATKKDSIQDFEEQYERDMEIAEEEGWELGYDYAKGIALFQSDIAQRKNYFQGTRNICEILATKYQLHAYGDVIRRFANNGVKMKDLDRFYENGWLGKKEFRLAITFAYEKYPFTQFDNYRW
jgi:hypothetical protein